MTDLEYYKGLSFFLIGIGSMMFLMLPFELKRRNNITNYSDTWLTATLGLSYFIFMGFLLAFRSTSVFFYIILAVIYLGINLLITHKRKIIKKKNKSYEK